MDPEDLPDLGELDEIDLGGPAPAQDAEPLVPPVEPIDPEPTTPGPLDLDELDLPDLPDRDWGAPTETVPAPSGPADLPDSGPTPADPGGRGPVELDLDDGALIGAADAPDPVPPGASSDEAPSEVDLSLDDLSLEDRAAILDADDDAAPELPDLVELPTDLTVEPFEVADANSWLTPSLLAAGVVALGLSASAFRRRDRSTPVDFAAQLDELGIDARVEHLDLTGLEELLEQGRPVLLSTDGTAGVDAGAVVALREIDRPAERVVVSDDRGVTFTVALDRFDAAWSDSANQVVVASGDDGGVALVPVTLFDHDLRATG